MNGPADPAAVKGPVVKGPVVKGKNVLPSIEVVLRGMALTSNEGNFAPCAVYLVRAVRSDGTPTSILYDFGHVGRRLKLTAAMKRRGIAPEQVDTVVVSHTHWDHLQNIDLFPGATALIHADELAYAAAPHPQDHATPAWSRALLDTTTVRTVEDGEEIANGVRVLHLPGHTPGCIGLAVDTEDGLAVVSGDALASAADARAHECPNVFWDPAAADASNQRVVDLADLVYPGHDRPFRINADGSTEYLTETRPLALTVGALNPDDVSVSVRERTGQHLMAHAAEVAAGKGA